MILDFHSVYKRYAKDIYRFALYLGGDPSQAEEIVQETFVRAWVTPETIRSSTLKAYLLTIAKNLYRADLRRERRHVALDGEHLDPRIPSAPEGEAKLATVLAALQRLPAVDRAALLMQAQDGLSCAEIATALELSVAAVKVKIHRARIKLNQWQAEGGES